ncbi:hypothetical protein F5Y08DRAFT_346345 [Xylaria arbuscula]|nr:hypothetical protein F5Y08DRAFT_346345 [Xylaria arbuscula]
MAELAVSSVNTVPIDPYADRLLQQLFNAQGIQAKTIIERTFAKGPANNKGERTGILTFEEEKTGGFESIDGDVNEVVIFCDTSRLITTMRDPAHMYDTKARQAVALIDPCLTAFMYTTRFVQQWDSIQICPWFLEYAKAKKYGTSKDIKSLRAKLAMKGLDKLITDAFYTPIDLLSLWDKCMLHEMVHTKVAGMKEDIGGHKGYGWKNCRALSADDNSRKNADSFALFGSALNWERAGFPIDDDGNFISDPIINQDGSKREVGLEVRRRLAQSWWG